MVIVLRRNVVMIGLRLAVFEFITRDVGIVEPDSPYSQDQIVRNRFGICNKTSKTSYRPLATQRQLTGQLTKKINCLEATLMETSILDQISFLVDS
jgi:hypothetical protein